MTKPATEAMPVRRIRALVLPPLGLAAVFSAVINVLMLTGSVYMLQVYDRVLPSGSVPTLLGLFAAVVILYALLAVYDLLRQRLLSRAGHRIEAELSGPVFGRFLAQGQPAAIRDAETLRGFLGSPAIPGLLDLPWVPLYLCILWLLHPLLAGLALVGVGLGIAFALAGQWTSRAALARAAAPEAEAQLFLTRTAESRELIAALGLGDRLGARWRGIRDKAQAEVQRGAERAELLGAMSRATRMLLQSALLTLGAWLAIRQDISAGSIVASSILSGRAMAPADQVLGQWRMIARAREAWARLTQVLADAGDRQAARPVRLPAPTGRIEVARLTKLAPAAPGTPAAERARLLDQVAFALEPGDGLAVIGASASGKSTLARVLTGFWLPEGGEVRLDGATRDQWEAADLGRHIGYLPQVVTLLPGTVRDNIARFDPQVGDEAVIAAARLAGVHEMILALPQGYATRVGTEGLPLSGGQMQRLGLARALLGRPRIVVLDEPNSNLDQAGDEALTAALTGLRAEGCTVIVMTHRPGLLAVANKILVLSQGRVARFGPKDEVMPPALVAGGPAPVRVAAAAPVPALAAPPQPASEGPRAQGRPLFRRNGHLAAVTGDEPATTEPLAPTGALSVFLRNRAERQVLELPAAARIEQQADAPADAPVDATDPLPAAGATK
ncbi:MAG: type I secretion system permease/ATPase [Paracoccaceae bacterium]